LFGASDRPTRIAEAPFDMTKSETVEVIIPAPDDLQEYLIAELLDLDFDGFVQEDDSLRAYILPSRWNDVTRETIEQWLQARGLPPRIEESIFEPQNWNERWEETIRPVSVPPFLIKPTWASIPEGRERDIVLEIDPKMSFGTGYHETTRLMLRLMPGEIPLGARVLDAGTGTGVLAIGALKLGAASAIGFDVDEWASDNAGENALLNGVEDRLEIRIGGEETIAERDFDVILANINLNVLIEMMPFFRDRLLEGGPLLLSGILKTDREAITRSLNKSGFLVEREAEEGDWLALVAR
jgi:ribosomal protein L11 methyltransferase